MKTIVRDCPGHFIDAAKCRFYLHIDIMDDDKQDAAMEAHYCVSLIGEYGARNNWGNLNASGKTYELMVFDKTSERPWGEIESFRFDDKAEAIQKHAELVKKYRVMS